MAPFEVLYGCRFCTTPNWIEPGEKVIFGPYIVDEAEAMVHHIQDNLKATSHAKRVMQTRCVDTWSLKLEITCI
jgi:hypothetical protein